VLDAEIQDLATELTDLSTYVYSLPGGIETLQQTLTAGNNAGGLNILNLGNLAIGQATATLPLDISGREIISVPGAPAGDVRNDVALTLTKLATSSTTNRAIIRFITRGGGGGLVYGHIGQRLLSGGDFGMFLNAVENPDTIQTSLTATGNFGIGVAAATFQLQLGTDSAGKPATNTWTVVSDKRLKDEIVDADLSRCYDIVKSLPLRRYTWKDEFYTTEQVKDRSKLGWIADEVESVFPKAVGIIPEWTYKQEQRDASGEIVEEAKSIENLKSLNSDQIYAVMYGAIQQLIHKVESLTHEIEILKSSHS
jgi:hypothetical protein